MALKAILVSDVPNFNQNSIASFNAAAKFPIDYIEFDVQVTKDDSLVIFHDNFVLSADNNGTVFEKRITEPCLSKFLSYGPQREPEKKGRSLLRKTEDGKIVNWDAILLVVFEYAKGRPIVFSSFQPDAGLLVRKLQDTYPVFFLTEGGTEIYHDVRRNSLEAAIKVCLEGGLEGIVSDVKGVFRNPGAVNKTKESKLSLLTYGKLNNVVVAVYKQHLMGIDGVIVDLVKEITEGVIVDLVKEITKPHFTQRELAFLLKLIPELIQ
ncbi:hypothetical protein SLA2020_022090 [Shorea laevis]